MDSNLNQRSVLDEIDNKYNSYLKNTPQPTTEEKEKQINSKERRDDDEEEENFKIKFENLVNNASPSPSSSLVNETAQSKNMSSRSILITDDAANATTTDLVTRDNNQPHLVNTNPKNIKKSSNKNKKIFSNDVFDFEEFNDSDSNNGDEANQDEHDVDDDDLNENDFSGQASNSVSSAVLRKRNSNLSDSSSNAGTQPPTSKVMISNQNSKQSAKSFSKYSCSLPREIPNMLAKFSKNSQSTNEDEENFDSNKRHKQNQLSLDEVDDDDERDRDETFEDDKIFEENGDMGQAIQILASSIVARDGRELFGGVPSRRIPINSISQSFQF